MSSDSALGAAEVGIGLLHALDLDALGPEALLAHQRSVEVLRRQLDAHVLSVTAAIERTQAHVVDGHRSTKAAVRAVCRVPGAEAHRRVQGALCLLRLPAVAAAYARGAIPLENLQLIARVAANPRVQQHLDEADPCFAEYASEWEHRRLMRFLAAWLDHADPDGAHDRDRRLQTRIGASSYLDFDGVRVLQAQFGPLEGAQFQAVWDCFTDLEYDKDLAEAAETWGPDEARAQLARTEYQRRGAALHAMSQMAAAKGEGVIPDPTVNIVIGQRLLAQELATQAGAEVEPLSPLEAAAEPCHTREGVPLTPRQVVAAMLIGFVRKVVVDDRGVVIDQGRRRRCFTGPGRDAVVLSRVAQLMGGCTWLGCDSPVRWAHVDHRRRWADGGPTDVSNGDLVCCGHNLLHELGFQVHWDERGNPAWTRPDGTPITRAA